MVVIALGIWLQRRTLAPAWLERLPV